MSITIILTILINEISVFIYIIIIIVIIIIVIVIVIIIYSVIVKFNVGYVCDVLVYAIYRYCISVYVICIYLKYRIYIYIRNYTLIRRVYYYFIKCCSSLLCSAMFYALCSIGQMVGLLVSGSLTYSHINYVP